MRILIATLISSFLSFTISAQSLDAYRIYTSNGEQIDFNQLVESVSTSDVVFFGELHNNPICHWLQFEVSKSLNDKRDLIMGAEMFESDDQLVLNEYLKGVINYDRLNEEAKLWKNYRTDYAPLVDFAKENNLKFIATNIPRRYASLVSKEGQAALLELDKDAKQYFPKMPFEVTPEDKGYEEMKSMMGGAHGHGASMDIDKLIEAQASKDYTMAYFINENRAKDQLFLHFNGAFHSKLNGGILGFLRSMNKKLDIQVITSVSSDDLMFSEDWKEQGDFILVIPNSMTKTY